MFAITSTLSSLAQRAAAAATSVSWPPASSARAEATHSRLRSAGTSATRSSRSHKIVLSSELIHQNHGILAAAILHSHQMCLHLGPIKFARLRLRRPVAAHLPHVSSLRSPAPASDHRAGCLPSQMFFRPAKFHLAARPREHRQQENPVRRIHANPTTSTGRIPVLSSAMPMTLAERTKFANRHLPSSYHKLFF
jgi:hypothetical protein